MKNSELGLKPINKYYYFMPKDKKSSPNNPPNNGKYDIIVKTNLSFDELVKLAVNTPKKKSK